MPEVQVKPISDKLELKLLREGLTYKPCTVNVIAKRLRMKESRRNLSQIKENLERMLTEQKVFRQGTRYAIDREGALVLMGIES